MTEQQHYDGDGVTITSTGGVPNAPSASLLRASRQRALTIWAGSIRRSSIRSIPVPAMWAASLDTEYYRDWRGNLIETIQPNGPVMKYSYNGLGGKIAEYDSDGAGGTSYAAASSVASDINPATKSVS